MIEQAHLTNLSEIASQAIVDIWNPTSMALAARQWVSGDGKRNFSPICKYRFNRSAGCNLGKGGRCRDCARKELLPLTHDIVRQHIVGQSPKHRAGIYPMLDGSSCTWIAGDLDNHDLTRTPSADLMKLIEVCSVLDIPLVSFNSNSGLGYHVYIFFESLVPARKARTLLLTLLERAGVDISHTRDRAGSFDCVFPKQDTIGKGEIGNLIALPYFGQAVRERNATLMLDHRTLEPAGTDIIDNFEIFEESLSTMSQADLDAILIEMGAATTASGKPRSGSAPAAETSRVYELVEKCSFLKHCKENAVNLSEPDWYMMICVLAREYGGPRVIHELSKAYPGYSYRECREKIVHALSDQPGPITCGKIKEIYDCGRECGVKCPVHLQAKVRRAEERNPSGETDQALTDLLKQAELGSDEAPYDAVRLLASLPKSEDMRWRVRFKSAMGSRINLNFLGEAIREERARLRSKKRSGENKEPCKLPVIQVGAGQLWETSNQALSALYAANNPASLFVRSGYLARIRTDEKGRPFIEQVSESALRGYLARCARWIREGKDGPVDEIPPRSVVQDILSLSGWNLPPLEGLIETPVIRPDGSILCAPGYDPATRLFYFEGDEFELATIPHPPGRHDAVRAAKILCDEILVDFPYIDEASRANSLALLLTPILRHAIDGKVPLALIDAPQAGSGKSLLAEIIWIISTGRSAAMATAPDSARGDDDEWRKRITSLLRDGGTVIVIDNVEGTLISPSLASVLTSDTWSDRILGRNEQVSLPQRATWLCTGNNIKLGADLPRRCYWIRLDAHMARPWQRSDFRHSDLVGWVKEHRGELVSALLCMASAWFAAGRPKADIQKMGSFENWTRTIGGILQYAEVGQFLGNMEELYEQADDDGLQWENFLSSWYDSYGERSITVSELTNDVLKQDGAYEPLKESIPGWLAEALGRSTGSFKRSLGNALSKRVGVHFSNGLRIEKDVPDRTKAVRWKVVRTSAVNS